MKLSKPVIVCCLSTLVLLGDNRSLSSSVGISVPPPRPEVSFDGFDEYMIGVRDLVPADNRKPIKLGMVEQSMRPWETSIEVALGMFPNDVRDTLGPLKVMFFADQFSWETANATGSMIAINLTPSMDRPSWMTWEPFPWGGYSSEERIWVAFHEIGHVFRSHRHLTFDPADTRLGYRYLSGFLTEPPSTRYGALDQEEDFADSFALYAMYPAYVRANFPARYTILKNMIGKEFADFAFMPNSVRSKLTSQCALKYLTE